MDTYILGGSESIKFSKLKVLSKISVPFEEKMMQNTFALKSTIPSTPSSALKLPSLFSILQQSIEEIIFLNIYREFNSEIGF